MSFCTLIFKSLKKSTDDLKCSIDNRLHKLFHILSPDVANLEIANMDSYFIKQMPNFENLKTLTIIDELKCSDRDVKYFEYAL